MKTIYEVYVHKNGTIEWFNLDRKRHRTDGPAIEYPDGQKEWWVDGKRHRTDGPAVEGSSGSKHWYVDGKRHRTDGPAIEGSSGSKYWYVDGTLHRTDGPAWEGSDGSKEWYVDGKHLSKKAFNARIKKQNEKDSCNDKIVEIDGKKYRLTLV